MDSLVFEGYAGWILVRIYKTLMCLICYVVLTNRLKLHLINEKNGRNKNLQKLWPALLTSSHALLEDSAWYTRRACVRYQNSWQQLLARSTTEMITEINGATRKGSECWKLLYKYCVSYHNTTLFPPWKVLKSLNFPYKVYEFFTAFWEVWPNKQDLGLA